MKTDDNARRCINLFDLPIGSGGIRETVQPGAMSALGQKRTSGQISGMSALPPKADILGPPKKKGTGTMARPPSRTTSACPLRGYAASAARVQYSRLDRYRHHHRVADLGDDVSGCDASG